MPTAPTFDVARLGQVFTPAPTVAFMLSLRRNRGRVLEPSCGDGAFFHALPADERVGIEFDPRHCPAAALNLDFFRFPESERFDTIIGNPPYVRFADINDDTRALLDLTQFDRRANLYLFFIAKCVRHLKPGGELIFIVPRELAKLTAARQLNAWLLEEGSFTTYQETGDARIFAGASPNCVIFRFERGRREHRLDDGRAVACLDGQLVFLREPHPVALADLFQVRVGGASGADACFTHPAGNAEVVCSSTAATGRTRRMFYNAPHPALAAHKAQLLARRIRPFDETNWWQWGRTCPVEGGPRLYVNAKTRHPAPFFVHPARHFDASVLGLFPRHPSADLGVLAQALNTEVDWEALGMRCDGRFLFSQRTLATCRLPARFARFLPGPAASLYEPAHPALAGQSFFCL